MLYDSISHHNFSTKDRDNDVFSGGGSCAVAHKGGWWYDSCHESNVNGLIFVWCSHSIMLMGELVPF